MNLQTLKRENERHQGTAGVSENNRNLGFRPAFLDAATGTIHLSRFANGCIAPVHVLDGLPDTLIEERDGSGRVLRTKSGVVSGFERCGVFVTREEAHRLATTGTATLQ
jgi:hypothetical protein